MKIDVEFDTSVLDRTAERYTKNLAYSTAQALNDCALQAQTNIRAQMRAAFQIRKPDFMDKRIKIQFASVRLDRTFADVFVDQKDRLLLSIFQEGGTRLPFVGRHVAVPITGGPARPGFADSVVAAFNYAALNIGMRGTVRPQSTGQGFAGKRRRAYRGSAKTLKGLQRTFVLTHTRSLPSGGVFQRTGPKRGDIRLVYAFRQSVQLRKSLQFIELATAAAKSFGDYFDKRFFRIKQ